MNPTTGSVAFVTWRSLDPQRYRVTHPMEKRPYDRSSRPACPECASGHGDSRIVTRKGKATVTYVCDKCLMTNTGFIFDSSKETPTMSASSAKTTPAAAAADRSEPMSLARMRRAPTHPGEIFLEEFLEGGARGKQAAAARELGWSANRMNEFVLGKRPLTYEGALDLAEFTKTSPEFWATLQMRHDLWRVMQARKSTR